MQKGAWQYFNASKLQKSCRFLIDIMNFWNHLSDKLQIRTTLGWSLELVHLSGSGPWTIIIIYFIFENMTSFTPILNEEIEQGKLMAALKSRK